MCSIVIKMSCASAAKIVEFLCLSLLAQQQNHAQSRHQSFLHKTSNKWLTGVENVKSSTTSRPHNPPWWSCLSVVLRGGLAREGLGSLHNVCGDRFCSLVNTEELVYITALALFYNQRLLKSGIIQVPLNQKRSETALLGSFLCKCNWYLQHMNLPATQPNTVHLVPGLLDSVQCALTHSGLSRPP